MQGPSPDSLPLMQAQGRICTHFPALSRKKRAGLPSAGTAAPDDMGIPGLITAFITEKGRQAALALTSL